jgi:hypothetical protein
MRVFSCQEKFAIMRVIMTIPVGMMCECLRCGHAWVKRISGRPARCPKCKQHRWDTPSPGIGRPPKAAGKATEATQPPHSDPDALWLWGCLKDFERRRLAERSLKSLLGQMAEPMREDSLRIGRELSAWLKTARPASARKRKAGE